MCLILQRVVGRESKECCWQGDGTSREKAEKTGAILWGGRPCAGSTATSLQASYKPLPAPGAFETAPEEGTRATAGEPAAVPRPVQHWKLWLPQSLGVLGFLAPNRSSF